MRPRRDKTPAEIKYMLNRIGLTFADVDRLHDLATGVARAAARRPHSNGELAIADVLATSPQLIWPSRFDPQTGARHHPQPSRNYTHAPRLRNSQKRRSA